MGSISPPPSFRANRWHESPKRPLSTFAGRWLTVLSLSFLASALAVTAPEPAFAGLEFCNRTTGESPLALALAYYNSGLRHVRYRKDGSPGLTITLNPRWTIRGRWEMEPNECVTPIRQDLNQTHYYYYVQHQNGSGDYSGDHLICGRKYGQFHIEYEIDNNKLVRLLALKPSGLDSVSVDPETSLQKACADLGYELLPFNQLHVGNVEEYRFDFTD